MLLASHTSAPRPAFCYSSSPELTKHRQATAARIRIPSVRGPRRQTTGRRAKFHRPVLALPERLRLRQVPLPRGPCSSPSACRSPTCVRLARLCSLLRATGRAPFPLTAPSPVAVTRGTPHPAVPDICLPRLGSGHSRAKFAVTTPLLRHDLLLLPLLVTSSRSPLVRVDRSHSTRGSRSSRGPTTIPTNLGLAHVPVTLRL